MRAQPAVSCSQQEQDCHKVYLGLVHIYWFSGSVHVEGKVEVDREGVARATVEEEPLDDAGKGVGDISHSDIGHLHVAGHGVDNVGSHDTDFGAGRQGYQAVIWGFCTGVCGS